MLQPANGILWLWKRTVGRAFLLGILSWIGLTLLWNQCQLGSPAFNTIAAIFRPGFQAGMFVARVLSPGRYTAPLLGATGTIIFLASIWYVVLFVTRKMRNEEPFDGLTPQ